MQKRVPSLRRLLTVKRAVYLILMVVALYGILPRLHIFFVSTSQLRTTNLYWLGIGIGCLGLSYICSAAEYYFLSSRRLPYRRTVIAQAAATFADRLLPAGSGALSVNYLYLRRQGITSSRALAMVATNNLIGVIGHFTLLGIILVTLPKGLGDIRRVDLHIWQWAIVAISLATILGGVVFVAPSFGGYVRRLFSDVFKALSEYWRQPQVVLPALGSSIGITASYAACLYAAALATGATITPIQALVVLTFGIAAATIIPTPGGLGGAEAGLTAGLVSFGLPTHNAFMIALVFRLLTFWLALIGGAVAFVYLDRRNYIQFSTDITTTTV